MGKKPGTFVRSSVDVSQPPKDGMDWDEFDALTPEEARAAAEQDPDNPPLTEEELARMRRVPDVRRIRLGTGLSQAKFAAKFGVPLASLKDWEQGRRTPALSTQTLMRIIEHEPEAVDRALHTARAQAG